MRAGDVDASGYEPVWSDGRLVGFVTSGGYGHTTDQSLAMAMVNSDLCMKAHLLAFMWFIERQYK